MYIFGKMMIFKQSMENYCNRTSIHGCRYIESESNWIKKFVWILITLAMTILALYLVTYIIIEYKDSKPLIYIKSTTAPLNQLYFPSVFICNINQVTRTALKKMGLDLEKDMKTVKNLFWNYAYGESTYYNTIKGQNWESRKKIIIIKKCYVNF